MSMSSLSLFLLVVLMIVFPLIVQVTRHDGAEFRPSDGQAEELITAIHPDYEPWFSPVFEPPGGEMESMLFALQAGIGAAGLGYVFGVLRERRRHVRA
jgi:cobalt/nickel transport protein